MQIGYLFGGCQREAIPSVGGVWKFEMSRRRDIWSELAVKLVTVTRFDRRENRDRRGL